MSIHYFTRTVAGTRREKPSALSAASWTRDQISLCVADRNATTFAGS
jgi:hypothetical protein